MKAFEHMRLDEIKTEDVQRMKGAASFYDFDEFERLVKAAQSEPLALLLVLLGGEAGLRCGEMMALA